MTYTEFIIEIENNIAKANCNKLNIGEYEEKQKQIYKQIRADAIDDLCNEISTYRMYDEYGNVIDVLEIVKRLKAGDKE